VYELVSDLKRYLNIYSNWIVKCLRSVFKRCRQEFEHIRIGYRRASSRRRDVPDERIQEMCSTFANVFVRSVS